MFVSSWLARSFTGLLLLLGIGELPTSLDPSAGRICAVKARATETAPPADDIHRVVAFGDPRPLPPFVMPQVKPDPNPLIIQGPAGEIFTFLRTGASTCGRYLMAKALIPPGAGPIPHVHHWTDEFFVMPEGGFTLFMGTQTYASVNLEPGRSMPKDHLSLVTTKPGDLFYGPRFIIHGLINNTQAPHVMYFIWMPDTPETSILPYFKRLGRTLASPDNPPPVDPVAKIRFFTEAPRYGINQSSDFFQYISDTDFDQRTMTADASKRNAFVDMLNSVGDGSHCPK